MKFGLIYEIPVPRPWHERSAYQAFQDVLEQITLADQLGFHSAWTVEHHFLDEYSFSSAPGVFYGALAERTRNIRIGHGVRLLPLPYNHPVRAAEAAATVDLLSNGRLEFGTGRSGTRIELEGFGIDPNDTRPMWEEALEVVVGCWTEPELSFDGHYFSLPPRGVVPKPLQQQVLSAHPAVHEAAVVGVPDLHWGEVVRAHVVVEPGSAGDPETLREHCRGLLAGYKVPSEVRLEPELPRNASGKVLKRVLRERE